MTDKNQDSRPVVAVIMGSQSDWDTMKHADETLAQFGVAHESRVISAHRSPSLAAEFGSSAEERGLEVIIAAAGGAAHLAGVLAAHTTLPVLGVPMKSDALNGLDSLLATVQMPGGIPVGTLAIGKPGAINAALFAVAILANSRPELRQKLHEFRASQPRGRANLQLLRNAERAFDDAGDDCGRRRDAAFPASAFRQRE